MLLKTCFNKVKTNKIEKEKHWNKTIEQYQWKNIVNRQNETAPYHYFGLVWQRKPPPPHLWISKYVTDSVVAYVEKIENSYYGNCLKLGWKYSGFWFLTITVYFHNMESIWQIHWFRQIHSTEEDLVFILWFSIFSGVYPIVVSDKFRMNNWIYALESLPFLVYIEREMRNSSESFSVLIMNHMWLIEFIQAIIFRAFPNSILHIVSSW